MKRFSEFVVSNLIAGLLVIAPVQLATLLLLKARKSAEVGKAVEGQSPIDPKTSTVVFGEKLQSPPPSIKLRRYRLLDERGPS